jgi:phosphonate transport system substrate-binding protein
MKNAATASLLATFSFRMLCCCSFFFFLACTISTYNDINYQKVKPIQIVSTSAKSDSSDITIAVAPLTSSVETYMRYNRLIAYTAARCSLKIKTTYYKKNSEILHLFESKSVDIAYVSSALFVVGKRKNILDLLVVPVKHGKSTHHACIIVQKNSPIQSWKNLEGRPFAFTDELSLTGFLYPIQKSKLCLAQWKEVYFTGSHDQSIYLVNRGLVEGASVDECILDDLREQNPDAVANVRVLEVSPEYGLQPIVISRQVPLRIRIAIQRSFCTMDSDSLGKKILDDLKVDKFITMDDSFYAPVFAMVPEAISQ